MALRKFLPKMTIHCTRHLRYRGLKKPANKCQGCWLIYVLAHQFSKNHVKYLGSLNPYNHLIDWVNLEEACYSLLIQIPSLGDL